MQQLGKVCHSFKKSYEDIDISAIKNDENLTTAIIELQPTIALCNLKMNRSNLTEDLIRAGEIIIDVISVIAEDLKTKTVLLITLINLESTIPSLPLQLEENNHLTHTVTLN